LLHSARSTTSDKDKAVAGVAGKSQGKIVAGSALLSAGDGAVNAWVAKGSEATAMAQGKQPLIIISSS
jgi:hypothetical protein